MINNSKIYFKDRATFENMRSEINDKSIVFIEDEQSIWTHGRYFSNIKELKQYVDNKYNSLLDGLADPEIVENVTQLINIVQEYTNNQDTPGANPIDAIIDISNVYTKDEVYNKTEVDDMLGGYLTLAEYESKLYPLSLSLTVDGSTLIEYNSNQSHIVYLRYYATKKGKSVTIDGNAATITINPSNGTAINESVFDHRISVTVGNPDTYTVRAAVTSGGEQASASASFTIVRPTYIGFDSENVNTSNLSKYVVSSLGGVSGKTIPNTVSGNYLWIVTPFNLNTVATDQGYTYVVEMQKTKTENGLNYYRSVSAVDRSELTYYIK